MSLTRLTNMMGAGAEKTHRTLHEIFAIFSFLLGILHSCYLTRCEYNMLVTEIRQKTNVWYVMLYRQSREMVWKALEEGPSYLTLRTLFLLSFCPSVCAILSCCTTVHLIRLTYLCVLSLLFVLLFPDKHNAHSHTLTLFTLFTLSTHIPLNPNFNFSFYYYLVLEPVSFCECIFVCIQ